MQYTYEVAILHHQLGLVSSVTGQQKHLEHLWVQLYRKGRSGGRWVQCRNGRHSPTVLFAGEEDKGREVAVEYTECSASCGNLNKIFAV